MTPRLPCARCGRPLVAKSSRSTGLCAGCTAEVDNTPATSGVVEHKPGCARPAVVERETPRRLVLTCQTCAAWLILPRVVRWGESR